jgi:hypothetical protein
MVDYDAIVVGAGHNGLTAAAILQRAGLRTVCLEANTYTDGMAATVELIDGFRYEIAGSVQFPTPSEITKDLGLGTLPTVAPDVMSVNIGGDCRFSSRVSNHGALTWDDARCLTSCHLRFVSYSCHFSMGTKPALPAGGPTSCVVYMDRLFFRHMTPQRSPEIRRGGTECGV